MMEKKNNLSSEPLPLERMPRPAPIETIDFIESLGEIVIGTRMKRLSEQLFPVVDQLYAETGIAFRAHWFALFRLLMTAEHLSISEIAERLGITHVAVQKQAKELLETGLVDSRSDTEDKRKRLLFLTPAGHQAVARFSGIWTAVEYHLSEMLNDAHPDFLGLLKVMEEHAKRYFTLERIRQSISGGANCNLPTPVRIVEFRPEFRQTFYDLNKQWVEKYFGALEPEDYASLERPEDYFLREGGFIFFAEMDGKAIGTIAMRYIDSKHYEICKMAVDQRYQGLGVGRKLIHKCIQRARVNGAEHLSLYTNDSLKAAMVIYERFGFRSIPFDQSRQAFSRVNTRMALTLGHRRLDESHDV
jgi:GNAT superfamily N-acetyltransferase/DNA-binding transcriptional ArsR family regulator